MVRRRLGRTGLSISPIGFGAFKIGRNVGIKYPSGYELPDDAEVTRLLHGILDLGINYIDTAPAYGSSEERIGKCLVGRRDEYVLSTKVGEIFRRGRSSHDFTSSAVRRSLQTSLQNLRTAFVDILFVHAGGRDLEILEQTDVVETILELRAAGLARCIGFSGKTVEGNCAALSWADVVMVEYHAEDQSQSPVLEQAAEAGAGVVVKKGLASGRLRPEEAIPFILRRQEVSSLLIGGLSLEHMQENVRWAEETGG